MIGTNTCLGDEGNGLVFEHEGFWYLKGIVSNFRPITENNEIVCDLYAYSVFMDVPYYYDWINSKIGNLN